MTAFKKIVIFALLLTFMLPVLAQTPESKVKQRVLTPEQNLKYLDTVLNIIKKYFYDKNYAGLKLDELKAQFAPLVKQAQTSEQLHAVINKMVAKFKASHFVLLEKEVAAGLRNEMKNKLAPDFGFKLRKIKDKYYATRFLEGGAAEKAGLKRGDEILEINGEKVAGCKKVFDAGNDVGIPGPKYFFIKAAKNEKITLKIKRKKDAEPKEITITASLINENKAVQNSVKVIEKGGKKIAYIHFWHFLTYDVVRTFYAALSGKFKNCDVLIMDIRGHGGSSAVIMQLLVPFKKKLPRWAKMRQIPRWHKPLVVLTDEGTRSAKEIFAHVVRRDKLGTLVGRKTQGAVLAASFHTLPDGAVLMLPRMNAKRLLKDKVDLEGKGVKPDVLVPFKLLYAAGNDEILEAGKKLAFKLVKTPAPVSPREEDF